MHRKIYMQEHDIWTYVRQCLLITFVSIFFNLGVTVWCFPNISRRSKFFSFQWSLELAHLKIFRFYNLSISLVMRQKGESQNGCFKKTELVNFLPPDTHTYVCVSGGKKCSPFGQSDMLCFLEAPALRFAFLPYYRQIERIILDHFITNWTYHFCFYFYFGSIMLQNTNAKSCVKI